MFRRIRSGARTIGRTALIAGSATAVSGHVAARQQARFTQGAVDSSPPTTQGAQLDVIEQLTKLADLKDRGVLTDEEFATQKAKVLGV